METRPAPTSASTSPRSAGAAAGATGSGSGFGSGFGEHLCTTGRIKHENRKSDEGKRRCRGTKTLFRLARFIWRQVRGKHDYGTCVYAVSLSAVATVHYVASRLGMTGFQVSCADLDILRRTRRIKGPLMVIDANDMLYPQTNPAEKLREAMDGWRQWAADEAKRHLSESEGSAAPAVVEHWRKLAAYRA